MSNKGAKTKPMTLTEKVAILRSIEAADDLTSTEKHVARAIALALNEQGIYSGSYATIARKCGFARATVAKAVGSLRAKYPGSFRVRNVGYNSSNDYKVLLFPRPPGGHGPSHCTPRRTVNVGVRRSSLDEQGVNPDEHGVHPGRSYRTPQGSPGLPKGDPGDCKRPAGETSFGLAPEVSRGEMRESSADDSGRARQEFLELIEEIRAKATGRSEKVGA